MEVQGAQSGQEYAVRLQFKACHVLTVGEVCTDVGAYL